MGEAPSLRLCFYKLNLCLLPFRQRRLFCAKGGKHLLRVISVTAGELVAAFMLMVSVSHFVPCFTAPVHKVIHKRVGDRYHKQREQGRDNKPLL